MRFPLPCRSSPLGGLEPDIMQDVMWAAAVSARDAMQVVVRGSAGQWSLHVPEKGAITVGRDSASHIVVQDLAASKIHVVLTPKRAADGRLHLLARDVSSNGTGYLRGTQGPEAAPVRIAFQEALPLHEGDFLVVPFSGKGDQGKPRSVATEGAITFVSIQTLEAPAERQARATVEPPVEAVPQCFGNRLHPSVARIWVEDGVATARDLANLYASEKDLRNDLSGGGVDDANLPEAGRIWKQARQWAVQGENALPAVPHPVRDPPPPAKRPRKPPLACGEPGVWHQQYKAFQEAASQRAREGQGLAGLDPALMEEVWGLFQRAGDRSSFWTAGVGPQQEGVRALLLRPFARYADSLRARLAPWKRWERFLHSMGRHSDEAAFRPDPMLLGQFLLQVEVGGPTAAPSMWAHLRWWATRLGISMPLESPLVVDFRFAPQGHQTKQATPLPLREWHKLVDLACTGASVAAEAASFMLLVAGACVRFRHAQRSRMLPERSGLFVAQCLKGKRRSQGVRPAFAWASPNAWGPESQALQPAKDVLRRIQPEADAYEEHPFLMPQLAPGPRGLLSEGAVWLPRPMTYHGMRRLVAALLRHIETPQPDEYSYYSFRRFLPTVADILGLDEDQSAAIGNWQDVPRAAGQQAAKAVPTERMAKRYAEDRVASAGLSKATCLVAVHYARPHLSGGADPDQWDAIRRLNWSLEELQAEARKWAEAAKEPQCPAEQHKQPVQDASASDDQSSASVGSSSSSESTGNERPEQEGHEAGTVQWAVQPAGATSRSTVVHFFPQGATVAYCRQSPFTRSPYTRGTGAPQAAMLGVAPCSRCLRLMGPLAEPVRREFE